MNRSFNIALRRFVAPGCLAIACLLGVSCAADKHAATGTSNRAPTFALPDDFFPIMSWELPPRSHEFAHRAHGLVSLVDCGFTVAGFVRPEDLPLCEKLGIRAIVCLDDPLKDWRKLSDTQIESSVATVVQQSGNSKAVVGYFLTDEPGAPSFAALGKAVATVKTLAPGKLAYINLFPDYATLGVPDLSQLGTNSYDEYLERFVREVRPQLISYDNYRVQYSNDMKNAELAGGYFANLLSIRRVAQEHGLPFWNIVSSNQIRKTTPPPSPANLLLQAYTTLAAGAQGLTWYTYYSGRYQYAPVDAAGNRTATWSYLKMVNDQVKVLGPIMRRLKSTGVYFTSPPPAPSLPALPGELVQAVHSETPVMVGEFSGADAKYFMLVNASLERSSKVQITLRDASGKISQVSAVDGSQSPVEDPNAVRLTAGEGILLNIR